jgi:hypothetical protein
MAGNPAQVAKTIDQLENVFFGMAGPQKRLSAAVACTVEAEDDVSTHWLNKRGWKHIRVSRIEVWPDGSTGGRGKAKSFARSAQCGTSGAKSISTRGKPKQTHISERTEKL